jgi:hypothetical protein
MVSAYKTFFAVITLCFLTLAACQANTLTPPTPFPIAASPIPATPTPLTATCADVDATWGNNWPVALDTLDQLIKAGQSCGEEPLLSKKYAAHYRRG